MKRFLFAALLAVTAGLLLAACGDDGETSAAEADGTAATSSAVEGATTIVEGGGIQMLGSDSYTLEVSATEEDGEVSGSGFIQSGEKQPFTVECSAEEGEIVMVGGTFEDGKNAGEGMAFLIKDLDPDLVMVWFEEKPVADGCDSMLNNIPADVLANDEYFRPLEEGDFSTGA